MSLSFKINLKVYLKIILLQLVIIILLFHPISDSLFIFIFIFNSYSFIPSNSIIIASFIALFVIYAPICLSHELLHAFAHKILGGKPRIGFKGLYAYTVETSEREYSRTELLIVLLLPVVMISFICIVLPWNLYKAVYYLNLLGSCGDIYMSLWLCRVDSSMRIIDRSYVKGPVLNHIIQRIIPSTPGHNISYQTIEELIPCPEIIGLNTSALCIM